MQCKVSNGKSVERPTELLEAGGELNQPCYVRDLGG